MSRTSSVIVTYAVVGSAAALAVAYVFGPSLFPSSPDPPPGSGGSVAVGIVNSANDCFINAVLQALAGLPLLRIKLAYQAKRLTSDPALAEEYVPTVSEEDDEPEQGRLTRALHALIEALNERPVSRKTISARPFIRTLEFIFDRHFSRDQQDAQEFLQLVLERLHDEHQRRHGRFRANSEGSQVGTAGATGSATFDQPGNLDQSLSGRKGETFLFEGKLDSHVQCKLCHFQPQPIVSTFNMLTLTVPQRSNVTLDECLDGMLKVETIDDYKCAYCCIQETILNKRKQIASTSDLERKQQIETEITVLHETMLKDPTQIPTSVQMLHSKLLPKRQISKHYTISQYPEILALHLSRSIFDSSSSSRKNHASLEYPEKLTMGGFNKRDYKLQCLLTHKGGHDSGHYEAFRRHSSRSRSEASNVAKSKTVAADDSEKLSAATTQELPSVFQRANDKKSKSRGEKAKGKTDSKWWRISDDRISDCQTQDVLSMKKEAYLLFYELTSS